MTWIHQITLWLSLIFLGGSVATTPMPQNAPEVHLEAQASSTVVSVVIAHHEAPVKEYSTSTEPLVIHVVLPEVNPNTNYMNVPPTVGTPLPPTPTNPLTVTPPVIPSQSTAVVVQPETAIPEVVCVPSLSVDPITDPYAPDGLPAGATGGTDTSQFTYSNTCAYDPSSLRFNAWYKKGGSNALNSIITGDFNSPYLLVPAHVLALNPNYTPRCINSTNSTTCYISVPRDHIGTSTPVFIDVEVNLETYVPNGDAQWHIEAVSPTIVTPIN